MNKKAFTLIELLAVIVILAIIASIAIPIVLNIISNAKDGSELRSAELYLDALELSIARATLDNKNLKDGTYDILENGNLCLSYIDGLDKCTDELKVEVKREIISDGKVTIKNNKIDTVSFILNNKKIIKNSKGELVYEPFKNFFVNGVPSFVLSNSIGDDVINYKLYGNSIQNGIPSIEAPVEIESVGNKTNNLLDFDAMKVINSTDTNVRGGWEFEFGEDTDITITHNSPETLPIGILLAKKVTDGVFGNNIQLTSNTTTISLKANEKLLVFVGNKSVTGSYKMLSKYNITKLKVEKGNVATDYESYGKYKIPIKISGKNLLDPRHLNIPQEYHGVTIQYLEDEDCFVLNGTTKAQDSMYYQVYINLPVQKGSYYSASTKYVSGTITDSSGKSVIATYFGASNEKNTFNNLPNSEIDLKEFDTKKENFQSNYDYITSFGFYVSNTGVTFDNYKVKVQLEKGTKATDYEPYVEPITTNIYLDEPLRKVNEYSDYIDFEKQKVIRHIVKYTSTGNEDWSVSSIYTDTISFYMNGYKTTGYGTIGNTDRLNILSNKLITKNKTDIECVKCTGNVTGETHGLVNITLFKSRIGYEDTDTNDQAVEKLKTWLSNNPITFIWPINEYTKSIEEPIKLPHIPTNKGTNIIEVDTTILPSNVEINYRGRKTID